MRVPPVDFANDFMEVGSARALLRAAKPASFSVGVATGVRWSEEKQEEPAAFLSIPNATVVVENQEILFLTSDHKYIPQIYPKPWPYAGFALGDDEALTVNLDKYRRRRLPGKVFMPVAVAGNWFHRFIDNYARLYWLSHLTFADLLTVALPFWFDPGPRTVPDDLTTIHAVFFEGRPTERLERGVYEVEQLIVPPLSNRDDFIFAEPTRFVSDRLCRALAPKRATHPLRLFVSRADTPVRGLTNEAALAKQLSRIGFTILCPGDYSFSAQLQLFAAAEIIVGVHGQGLTAMICAQNCKALLEFEAADWTYTPYRSIAEILGMTYERPPCDQFVMGDPERFDWQARADIDACLAAVRRVLGSG